VQQQYVSLTNLLLAGILVVSLVALIWGWNLSA
jgi:hypothetical protein